jgi:ribosomal protein S18 acetylase RimI-like enzyme
MIRKRIASLDDRMIYRLVVEEIAPFSSMFQDSSAISFSMIRKRLSRNVTFVAAEGSGSAFGFVSLIRKKRTLFVDMLAVHAKTQGRGWGKKLMQTAERFGLSSGCETIHLYVDVGNPAAIGFYERLGYMQAEYLQAIDCYRMDKQLRSSRF